MNLLKLLTKTIIKIRKLIEQEKIYSYSHLKLISKLRLVSKSKYKDSLLLVVSIKLKVKFLIYYRFLR